MIGAILSADAECKAIPEGLKQKGGSEWLKLSVEVQDRRLKGAEA